MTQKPDVIPAFAKLAQQSELGEWKRRQDVIIRGIIEQLPPDLPPGSYVIEVSHADSINPIVEQFKQLRDRISGREESANAAHIKGTSARGKE